MRLDSPAPLSDLGFLHLRMIDRNEEYDPKRKYSLQELHANGGKFLVIQALREMPYADYLRTAHWMAVRAEALSRANYHCQVCMKRKRCDIHHITYERRGFERPNDIIALCSGKDGCHAAWHQSAEAIAKNFMETGMS